MDINFSEINGKTIKSVKQVKKPLTDDNGWLLFEFTDGFKCVIKSSYGGHTGNSEEEFPTRISISDDIDGFVDGK